MLCSPMYVYVSIVYMLCSPMYVYVSTVYMLCSPIMEELKNLSIHHFQNKWTRYSFWTSQSLHNHDECPTRFCSVRI